MHTITVETTVRNGLDKVWEAWTAPEHIMHWNFASDDWECPYAENNLTVGGKFLSRMAAKDGSASFDFTGTYTEVRPGASLVYTIDDGRTVSVTFTNAPDGVHVVTTFGMENENSEELQHNGWQAILNNFKKYAEQQ